MLTNINYTSTSSIGNKMGVGFNFNNFPTLNYSRRYLNRADNGELVNNSTITHTITPSYKLNLPSVKIGLNTNLVVMNYYDFFIKLWQ